MKKIVALLSAGGLAASPISSAFFQRQSGKTGLLDSYLEDTVDRAYTYDNALATMAFLANSDTRSARRILEAFRTIGPRKEGGFLEAYHASDGKPDGILTGGPNAYLLQAINLYFRKTGDARYNGLARRIGDYLLSLQDADGGLFGRKGVTWKSTENNLAAYAALKTLGNLQKKPFYAESAESIKRFIVERCWNGTRFLRGKDDPTEVTDVQALGVLALGADYASALRWVEEHTRTTKKAPDGLLVTGFDFNGDRDTVWTEGTLQMALAYMISGESEKSAFYRAEAEKLALPSGALRLATNTGTTGIDWTLQPWSAVAPTAWHILLARRENLLQIGE